MILIVLYLLPTCTEQTLRRHIEQGLNSGWSFSKGKVLKVNIMHTHYVKPLSVMTYGLVYVDSKKTGNKIIKKLNNSVLLNNCISIKEYHIRSYHNDNRAVRSLTPYENRLGDRRSKRGLCDQLSACNLTGIFK